MPKVSWDFKKKLRSFCHKTLETSDTRFVRFFQMAIGRLGAVGRAALLAVKIGPFSGGRVIGVVTTPGLAGSKCVAGRRGDDRRANCV